MSLSSCRECQDELIVYTSPFTGSWKNVLTPGVLAFRNTSTGNSNTLGAQAIVISMIFVSIVRIFEFCFNLVYHNGLSARTVNGLSYNPRSMIRGKSARMDLFLSSKTTTSASRPFLADDIFNEKIMFTC